MRKYLLPAVVLPLYVMSGINLSAQEKVLFDGKSLEGWTPMPRLYIPRNAGFEQMSPEELPDAVLKWYNAKPGNESRLSHLGKWEIVDGAITGGHVPDDSRYGAYLVSDGTYGDFELELDAWPDWPVDTGIMLRANKIATLGLQVLVDYRPHGAVGGVYGNSLGGFLAAGFFLDGDRDGFRASNLKEDFRSDSPTLIKPDYAASFDEFVKIWNTDGWNHFKIRCVGEIPVITVWINGLKTCEIDISKISGVPGFKPEKILSRLGREGHIAFEVHDVPENAPLGRDRWEVGAVCRWKNIVIREL